ncbi:hypothetical protein [Leptolyngbya sp. FACHB-8]
MAESLFISERTLKTISRIS